MHKRMHMVFQPAGYAPVCQIKWVEISASGGYAICRVTDLVYIMIHSRLCMEHVRCLVSHVGLVSCASTAHGRLVIRECEE